MKQPPSETREESTESASQPTRSRATGALLVVTGLAHLVAPESLLRVAGRSYSSLLDVEFDPRSGATNRVRLLGVGLIAAGAHLLYYGGIRPSSE